MNKLSAPRVPSCDLGASSSFPPEVPAVVAVAAAAAHASSRPHILNVILSVEDRDPEESRNHLGIDRRFVVVGAAAAAVVDGVHHHDCRHPECDPKGRGRWEEPSRSIIRK